MKKNFWSFGEALSGKLANLKLRWSSSEVDTKWRNVNRAIGLQSDTSFWKIITGVEAGEWNVAATETKVVVQHCTNGTVDQAALYDIQTPGKMKLAEVNSSGVYSPYGDKRRGSMIKATLLFAYLNDAELLNAYEEIIRFVEYGENGDEWDDPMLLEKAGKAICLLTNNIYYHFKDKAGDTSIEVEQLRVADVTAFAKGNVEVKVGNPTFITKKQSNTLNVKVGRFAFNQRALSATESSLVPQMAQSYVCPEWVETVSEDLCLSTQFSQPMRNVLLTGSSGSGKTKGAQAIASMLGLPYVKVTCSPDTDMFSFIGQILPNTDDENVEETFKRKNLPSFEDVENDFKGVFKILFGKEAGKYDSPADCYTEILKRITAKEEKDFIYVESDFIKAIKYGWVVEVQEPTVIKRESVLVGLNAIMENDRDTSTITLPTGELIRRHPDAVVVMTTNADYKGCKSIQQSVLSRMDIVREVKVPTSEEMAERCMALTGFPQKKSMLKMSKIISEINKYCEAHDITDGVCGPRELNNWAKKAIMMSKKNGEVVISDETIVDAAFPVLLTKVSQNTEEMEEIITSVFQKQYDQFTVENSRKRYEYGEI